MVLHARMQEDILIFFFLKESKSGHVYCTLNLSWEWESDSSLKKTRGDALCFPGRVILTELADLIELDFFFKLVQHCDVSAHKVF